MSPGQQFHSISCAPNTHGLFVWSACSGKDTHAIAEANQEKNARLRDAFGLGDGYVDGSAFDPNRKAKEEAARAAAAAAQKQYA